MQKVSFAEHVNNTDMIFVLVSSVFPGLP